MDFDDFKYIIGIMICAVGVIIVISFLLLPMQNIQCDKFNELFRTNYTHSDWWWNSEAIKLSHATRITKGE